MVAVTCKMGFWSTVARPLFARSLAPPDRMPACCLHAWDRPLAARVPRCMHDCRADESGHSHHTATCMQQLLIRVSTAGQSFVQGIPEGQEMELATMIIECCSNEKTFIK